MGARTRLLGGLGALATLVAVAVLLDPGLADALPGISDLLESRDPERLLLGLGGVVAAYAAWTARAGSSEPQPTDGSSARFARDGDPPEVATAAERTRTGESFDARVEAACAGDDEALRAVQSTLVEAAASALERTGGRASSDDRTPADGRTSASASDRIPAGDYTRATARRAIETGDWTDDDLVAAFLADEEGPGFSLLARLRAWLDPEAERRRRVERTVDAISQSMHSEQNRTSHGGNSVEEADR